MKEKSLINEISKLEENKEGNQELLKEKKENEKISKL